MALFVTFFGLSSGLAASDSTGRKLPKGFTFIQEPVFNGALSFYKSNNRFQTTVMLIHGAGPEASGIWANLIPALEKNYRVVCFDLPGFGRSGSGDALYSPKNYAALLKWIYDHHVHGPMVLIGHSLGAAIALYYAGTYPQSLGRLVLVDAAGILHRTAYTRSLAGVKLADMGPSGMFKNDFGSIGDILASGLLISKAQEMLPKDLSPLLDHPLVRRKLLDTPSKIAAAALINTDFSHPVKNVKVPTSIIWGENDTVAPLRTGKMLAWLIDGASLHILPGGSHSPMLDRPAEFRNLILKCLAAPAKKHAEKNDLTVVQKARRLDGKNDVILEGHYERIELRNCRSIRLKNVFTPELTVIDSSVDIEKLVMQTGATAISAANSLIAITGGEISAGVGLSVSNSRIDLAGVRINARHIAVLSSSEIGSVVVCSLCDIRSLITNRPVHDIFEITYENPL